MLRYAKLLEDTAVDLGAAADSNETEAPELLRRAQESAATERATVEAAELVEAFTAQRIQDQDAVAVAADAASTGWQREPGAVRHRAAVEAAPATVEVSRAEIGAARGRTRSVRRCSPMRARRSEHFSCISR